MRKYVVRAVWDINMYDTRSCDLDLADKMFEEFNRPSDYYAVYRTNANGTQRHVIDFKEQEEE